MSSAFTDVAGISKVFIEGAVTYCEDAKIRRLGVKRETIDKYGVVSVQVAAEMAEGIAKTSGSYIGISTTGIAGPSGGTPEKPVGTVCIGLRIGSRTITRQMHFNGKRETVRARAVDAVFDLLRRELEKEEQID